MTAAAAIQKAKIVTANRLTDGRALFWAGQDWTEMFAEACPMMEPDTIDAALARATSDVAAQRIVEPYPFDVRLEGDSVIPLRQRERIRATGLPTVGNALGWRANLMTAHF